MALSGKIIELRKQQGLSQEELAAAINVSRQSVHKWESGKAIPDLDKIVQMSKLFDVSTDYLINNADEPGESAPSGGEGGGKRASKLPWILVAAEGVVIAALALVLVLSGARGGKQSAAAYDESTEFGRAILMGYTPDYMLEDLSAPVTEKQFCDMLSAAATAKNGSVSEALQKLTANAPNVELPRERAAGILRIACYADVVGLPDMDYRFPREYSETEPSADGNANSVFSDQPGMFFDQSRVYHRFLDDFRLSVERGKWGEAFAAEPDNDALRDAITDAQYGSSIDWVSNCLSLDSLLPILPLNDKNEFRVHDPLTREEAVLAVYRVMNCVVK